MEPDYDNIPGQWGAIWLKNGSTNNKLNHATIKNATIGLLIQNNDGTTVSIKNTQIFNAANYGIYAQTALIEGENIVINAAGLASLACTYGGSYQFTHSTFNNNWNSSSQVAVSVTNYNLDKNADPIDLTKATFNNCIIYGSYFNELFLDKKPTAQFNYQFNNCLIKYDGTTTNANYLFQTDATHYTNIILNQSPKFQNINLNKLNIDATSGAFAKGNATYLIPLDILGNTRTIPPDLGAYQNMVFPK